MYRIFFLLAAFPLFAAFQAEVIHKARSGNIEEAVSLYQKQRASLGRDDLELIEQMALVILDQGYRSKDPKEQFLATFGAGVARSSKLLYILEDGLKNDNPQIQLTSLYFLNDLRDDHADELIRSAMNSIYLPIRLEAAKILAARRDCDATDRVEGLMCKLDPELHCLFPPLFALSSDEHATSLLKRCFSEKDPDVRLASVLACIDYERDDLLPQIRTLACCGNLEEQEAAAFALGRLQDTSSLRLLKTLTKSPYPNVRLAALISLYRLGDLEVASTISSLAKKKDPFAITALGDVVGSEELLYSLCQSSHLQTRFNATLALLKRRDPRSVPTLLEILLKDSRDIALIQKSSAGMVLSSWHVIPSSSSKFDSASQEAELLIASKEEILLSALDLSKEDFFKIASALLESKDPELVPALIGAVEALQCPESVEFLKRELQRAGAPLVRAYCNLALFRLKEPGPYAAFVRQWVKDLKYVDLIHFRPLMPRTREVSSYKLTAHETSRLFVEAASTLANEKDEEALDALLMAMSQGHPSNRFALSGLIIRAIE